MTIHSTIWSIWSRHRFSSIRWALPVSAALAAAFGIAIFWYGLSVSPSEEVPSTRRTAPLNSVVGTGQHRARSKPESGAPGIDVDPSAQQATRYQPLRHRAPSAWDDGLTESRDYFQLVRAALPAAIQGDTSAQFAISEALSFCEGVLATYEGESSPEAIWSKYPNLSAGLLDMLREDYARCSRFASADAFAGLPVTDHGYSSNYWRELAVSGGNPIAEADKAFDLIAIALHNPRLTKSERKRSQDEAIGLLKRAAQAGNADAYWYMGLSLLAVDRDPSARDRGAALVLLACRSGYDCSAHNRRNLVIRCNRLGDPNCPPGASVQYYLQRAVGDSSYARAFALSESWIASLQAGSIPTIDVTFADPE